MIGIYSLANDVVYEQFLAFIRSFRKYNPVLPITVIRFDNKVKKITALSEKYNFKIWSPAFEQELNDIGSLFEPNNKTQAKFFKKFSVFWGEYDTFIYLDSDVVVVDDLTPILEKFEKSQADVLFLDSDPTFVYNPGLFRDKMSEEHNSAHMNAGTFGSKKNAITLGDIHRFMQKFEEFKNELCKVGDQPFLNYCFDMKDLRKLRIDSIVPDKSFTAWYNVHIERKGDSYFSPFGQMVAVHWAGCSFSDIHKHHAASVFLRCRLLGESGSVKYRYFMEFYHLHLINLLTHGKHLRTLLSLLRM